MTVTLISADNLAGSYFLFGTGNEGWLMPGVTISNDNTFVIELSGVNGVFGSDGTILARYFFPGVRMYDAGQSLIFGSSSIFRSAANVGSPGILSSGGTASVTNHGLISTAQGVAIGLLAGGNSIFNDGSIEGGSGGVFLGLNGGVGDRMVNDGTIIAGNTLLPAFSERFNHAVQIEGNGSVFINYGTVSAVAANGDGVHFGATTFFGAGSRVENFGTITSALFWGVDMFSLTNGGAILYNHGLISGGVRGSSFGDVVTNSGTTQGNIDLGLGNDRFDGRGGVVFGQIGGGLGNDTLIGGAQDDTLIGDVGNDILRGNAGDDSISGGSGNDILNGNAGDDSLSGGDGNDVISAGFGDDTVFGGLGSDQIFGRAGDDSLSGDSFSDTIYGGDGDDEIYGGSSPDVLNGGRGNDTMSGGTEADRFVFIRGGGDDQILDFQNGVDKLDLHLIGFVTFASVAAAAHTIVSAVVIDLPGSGGGSIVIEGLTMALFDATDVIL